MSTNHRERLERVVDKALDDARKEAGILEKPGFAISGPSIWPIRNEQGQPTGESAPAWFVTVTIKSTGIGEPDIGNGFPVYGILPEDKHFQSVAVGLLGKCLEERSKQDMQANLAVEAAKWSKDGKA